MYTSKCIQFTSCSTQTYLKKKKHTRNFETNILHPGLNKCGREVVKKKVLVSNGLISINGTVALLPITQRPLAACSGRNSGCQPGALFKEPLNCFPRQHQYLRMPRALQRLRCKRLLVAAVVLKAETKGRRRGRMSQGRWAGDQSSLAALSTRYSGTWSPRSMQTKESTFLSRTPGESAPSAKSKHVVFFHSRPRALLLSPSPCPPPHIPLFTAGSSTAVLRECSRVSRWRHSPGM